MRDLAIDPTTSDLALTASAATLTSGTDAKAQRLRTRLALWQGEYPLDLDVGIPFTRYLGEKNRQDALETTLRRAILTSPGIIALDEFALSVGDERDATLSFVAVPDEGEPIALDDFRVS